VAFEASESAEKELFKDEEDFFELIREFIFEENTENVENVDEV